MLLNRLAVLFYATAMLAACDNHSTTALAAPTPDKAAAYELRRAGCSRVVCICTAERSTFG